MSTILTRLERARQKEPSMTVDVADRMYSSMMADIKAKALSDARILVQAELDAARAEILKAQAETSKMMIERDSAIILNSNTSVTISELKAEVQKLKDENKQKDKSLEMNNQGASDNAQILRSELKEEQLKNKNLEIQIANLNGKISELKTKPKNLPIVSPVKIPSFKAENPVRGQDGTIRSITITPIGLN